MKLLPLLALTTLAAAPSVAEETRQVGSHEHGVGKLNIAIDGTQVAMEFHAPGADIVGFEYTAESAEDLAKVEMALTVLAQPLDLFVLPEAAGCSVVEAQAELISQGDHDDHADHDGEDHDDHDDHDHDHAGDAHDKEAGHTEFHAEYLLACDNMPSLTEISFAYFTAFPNAREVEVQLISDVGATAFEVERDAPMLDLGDLN